MKFNFFKIAKAAQTTLGFVEDVNSTYVVDDATGEAPLSVYAAKDRSEGTTGLDVAQAVLNQDWFDLAKLGFDKLIDLVSKDPLTYEEYLESISQFTDVKIIEFSQTENLNFIAGECTINVIREEKFVSHKVQLYFKNSSNKWILKELSGKTDFKCFVEDALDGGITDVENAGGLKFPILKPEELK